MKLNNKFRKTYSDIEVTGEKYVRNIREKVIINKDFLGKY